MHTKISDKERKIVKKSKVLWIQIYLIHILKDGCNPMWVQSHVGAIPRLPKNGYIAVVSRKKYIFKQ